MIPGVLEPGLFGWDASTVQQMTLHEYTARVLGKLCEAALAEVRSGRGKLVNYRQLPAAVWPALLRYWRADFSEDEMARMLNAASLNAKNPVLPFEEDSLAKRNSATPETRALTEQWLDGVYQQLETARLARGFA